MEDALKDQSAVSGNKGGGYAKLLRYPLRSGTKSKDDKPSISASSTASASRRGRPSSSVSQSVSVLDISGKEKSAKPPRRLSIPTKSTASPAPKPASNITPISEARAYRSRNIEGKSDTPVSDVSRSLSRRKFSVLSSASYWLSHIKISEAAGKHQVSLGFFKLAQVAVCENLQQLRDELKSYALRHNILDLGESAKEVLQSYDIPECIEQVQVSETYCTHEPEQGTRSLSDVAHSLSSINGVHKPKPRSSNDNAGSTAKESAKENNQKNLVSRTKSSTNKKRANQQSVSQAGHGKMQKDLQKPNKKESNKEKQMVKSKGKKSATEVYKGQRPTRVCAECRLVLDQILLLVVIVKTGTHMFVGWFQLTYGLLCWHLALMMVHLWGPRLQYTKRRQMVDISEVKRAVLD